MHAVVLSIDAELGWGFHHRDPIPEARVRAGRTAWARLCSLFDEFDVPATWAVVGHLLQRECSTTHVDHPAGERCCTTTAGDLPADDVWFATDLVDRVRESAVDHDLACHGHTHVHFQHEVMDRSLAEWELTQWSEAAASHGIEPGSVVFPVNEVAYRNALADHGFQCYRGPRPEQPGRVEKLSDAVRGRGTPPIVHPTIDEHGLVNVPASQYLYEFEGVARSAIETVRDDPIVGQVERGLDALADEAGVLHLWLHPHNLTEDRDYARLRRILEHVSHARQTSDITVETMADIARRTRDQPNRGEVRVH